MFSPICILRNPTTWITVLVSIFIFSCFSAHKCLFLLITSLVLITSTIFLSISKQKTIIAEKPIQDESLISSEKKIPLQLEEAAYLNSLPGGSSCKVTYIDFSPTTQNVETRALGIPKVEEEEEEESKLQLDSVTEFSNRSPDLYSEPEIIDDSTSSEDSDIDWLDSGNVVESPDGSDDSISDEEGLIEIVLPTGNYVGPKEENPRFNLQQKFTSFSAETIFQQDGEMELFAEMNEEENLIEIDISMGSIKCSKFEIEA